MANVQTPELIKFCNEQLRVAADLIAQTHYRCQIVEDLWNAGLSTQFSNSSSDYIQDTAYGVDEGGEWTPGDNGDGRPVITTENVWLLMTRIQEATKSVAELNTILAVAVNPTRE